jgi:hypothetical protein
MKTMPSDTTTYFTTCGEDEDGNVILDLPPELIDSMGWGEGTVLEIELLEKGMRLRAV